MRLVGHQAQAAQRQEENAVSLCSFMVETHLFGIETCAIREVLGPRVPERVPLAPVYLCGLLSYRSEIITAVSLRCLLGLAPAKDESCVVVLDAEDERFGLMVDAVQGVEVFKSGQFTPNPTTLDPASRSLFRGAYRKPEGLLIMLDPVRLGPTRLAQTGLFAQTGANEGVTR